MMHVEAGADQPNDAETITSLRGEVPRVVRLSHKAVAAAGGLCLALVGCILIYALQPASIETGQEQFDTGSTALAEGVASAPKDYSQVPRLGPPLPGDLGKPILDAQERGAVAELPPIGAQPPAPQQNTPEDAARQRREQEREAAIASRLFAGGGSPAAGLPEAGPVTESDPVPDQVRAAASPRPFLERPPQKRTASLQLLKAAPSGAVLHAGSIIPAALITGIRSDQPGLVTAHVTANVWDSLAGRRLLIPQGSRLIGDYESDVGFGQRRVLLAWNRLILPDGQSIVLERQPAADPSGYAGLEDGVDYNWGGITKAALISTLLGIGAERGAGGDADIVRALRRGGQDSFNRAGEQIVSRELGIRPTLTIRPGHPVRILVTRDIVLEKGS